MRKGSWSVLFYVLLLIVLGFSVEYKKNIIREKKSASVVSVLDERKKQGIPVEVLKVDQIKNELSLKVLAFPCGTLRACFFETREGLTNLGPGKSVFAKDGKTVLGKISSISRRPDLHSGLYRVEIELARSLSKDKFDRIQAVVKWKAGGKSLIVPTDALGIDSQGVYVWIVKDGAVEKRQIQLKTQKAGDFSEIKSGIEVGEVIVVSGGSLLQDKLKVNILNRLSQTEIMENRL